MTWMGQDTALKIQWHVDVALGRLQSDETPNPRVTTMSEFYELLAHEKSIEAIADRISANAIFVDSDNGLLPRLGLSWSEDILPLLDGRSSPGYMPVQNAEKFLGIVRNIKASAEAISDDVRKRRLELVGFLERAVKVGEPIWCEL